MIGSILGSIIIGGFAGFIAEKLMKSEMGLIANILLGIAGGLIAGWLLPLAGIGFHGLIGSLIGATAGACLLIFIARLIKK
jgi:uncharacterized membrane protein YeaQ/YmgE (transglycosylase-associated protein family)